MAQNIQINYYDGSAYEVLYPETLGSQVSGTVSSATTATQLATSRTIRTNLASTSTASFNGTSNITPGVTGVLPQANGGTGYNNIASFKTALGLNIYEGYYKGTGTTSPSITFPFTPKLVIMRAAYNEYRFMPLIVVYDSTSFYETNDCYSPIFYGSITGTSTNLQSNNCVMWRCGLSASNVFNWDTYYNGNLISSSSLGTTVKTELCRNRSGFYYGYFLAG